MVNSGLCFVLMPSLRKLVDLVDAVESADYSLFNKARGDA